MLYQLIRNCTFSSRPNLMVQVHEYRMQHYVMPSSPTSERVFSCSGNIVTPRQASMNPDKVDVLTFLSKNLD